MWLICILLSFLYLLLKEYLSPQKIGYLLQLLFQERFKNTLLRWTKCTPGKSRKFCPGKSRNKVSQPSNTTQNPTETLVIHFYSHLFNSLWKQILETVLDCCGLSCGVRWLASFCVLRKLYLENEIRALSGSVARLPQIGLFLMSLGFLSFSTFSTKDTIFIFSKRVTIQTWDSCSKLFLVFSDSKFGSVLCVSVHKLPPVMVSWQTQELVCISTMISQDLCKYKSFISIMKVNWAVITLKLFICMWFLNRLRNSNWWVQVFFSLHRISSYLLSQPNCLIFDQKYWKWSPFQENYVHFGCFEAYFELLILGYFWAKVKNFGNFFVVDLFWAFILLRPAGNTAQRPVNNPVLLWGQKLKTVRSVMNKPNCREVLNMTEQPLSCSHRIFPPPSSIDLHYRPLSSKKQGINLTCVHMLPIKYNLPLDSVFNIDKTPTPQWVREWSNCRPYLISNISLQYEYRHPRT